MNANGVFHIKMLELNYSKLKTTGHHLYLSQAPCFFTGGSWECFNMFFNFLDKEKIQTVVVLLGDYTGSDYRDIYEYNGINTIHYPIKDYSIPKSLKSFHKLVEKISDILKRENVLIHCASGRGRTGTVAAGLAVYKGHNAKSAIDLIRRARKSSIETKTQREFVRDYYDYIKMYESLYLIA